MKGCNTGVVPTDGTITEIVEGSFYGCTLLSSTITIPASVTKIGLFAFHNCYNITGIIVENGNPTYYSVNNCLIEKSTGILIKGCNNSVIPNDGTITQIADYAFYSCNSLSGNLIIPNGVVSVGIGAFGYCGYRGVLEIPSSVAYIGESAFCSLRFSSISVDSSNTVYYSVGNCLIEYTTGTLLQGCPSSIIPNDGTIKIIEKNAFNGCASASIIIPESVTTINARAFEYCAALTSIVVPKNVTFIDNYAFNNCTSFTSITISATVPPTIGATNVFTNTNNCPIYVPAASVAAYKTAQNWSSYASRIQAISA